MKKYVKIIIIGILTAFIAIATYSFLNGFFNPYLSNEL